MSVPPPTGSVTPTPRRALAVAVLFGALSAWLVYVTAGALDASPPQIGWITPVTLALIGSFVGVLAYSTHQRIQVRRERVDADRAVAFLVLGKAAALAGSFVAGGFLLYGLLFVLRLDADGPRDRAIKSAFAVLAGLGLAVAGLLLERACRVPHEPDERRGPESGDGEGSSEDPYDPADRVPGT